MDSHRPLKSKPCFFFKTRNFSYFSLLFLMAAAATSSSSSSPSLPSERRGIPGASFVEDVQTYLSQLGLDVNQTLAFLQERSLLFHFSFDFEFLNDQSSVLLLDSRSVIIELIVITCLDLVIQLHAENWVVHVGHFWISSWCKMISITHYMMWKIFLLNWKMSL